MKKHLHGRRHLRARASVQVGREKRRMHKISRMANMINRVDWPAFALALSGALEQMVEAMAAMVPMLRREVTKINGYLKLHPDVDQAKLKEIINGLS